MGKEAKVAKIGLSLSLKLGGGGWGRGPNMLGLCHQTTGSSLVCAAVWVTDKAQ